MTDEIKHTLDPEKWVEQHGDYLFSYAVLRVSDAEKAEDLVQETFLAGLKGRENFQGKSSERTWLVSILKRKIIDTYRKRSSSKEETFPNTGTSYSDPDFYRAEEPFKGHWLEGKGPHSNSILPEGEIEHDELNLIIEKCIELLPPNLAAVFIMKMLDEAASDEICKELDITSSNLWVILHRARLKLRDCLETNWLN